MKLKTVKKTLHRHAALTGILFGILVYVGFGIAGVVPLVAQATSGFTTISIKGVNGYPVGSSAFGTDGHFVFGDAGGSGVTWDGYAKTGNAYLTNKQFLGWQVVGNQSIGAWLYTYTFDTLVYTSDTAQEIMPTTVSHPSFAQYWWYHTGDFGDTIEESPVGTMSFGMLDMPSGVQAREQAVLHLSVDFEVKLDPTLIGQGLPVNFTDSTTGAAYHLDGFWAGVLNATAVGQLDAGTLSQPHTYIQNSNFSTSDATSTSASPNAQSDTEAGTNNGGSKSVSTSAISGAIAAVQSSGDPFAIRVTSSDTYTGTSQEAAADTKNTAIPLFYTQTGSQTNAPNYSYTLINDTSRGDMYGSNAFILQPGLTITSTTYDYKNWRVHSADACNFLCIGSTTTTTASYVEQAPSVVTLINCYNVYAETQTQVSEIIATNYTEFNPLNPNGPAPTLAPPTISGTDGTVDPSPTNHVVSAGGNPSNPTEAGLLGLENFVWWIIAAAAVVVVIVLVYRIAKYKLR